jgi:tripartite-type tricarboxylate transporter receptor subunit TctC
MRIIRPTVFCAVAALEFMWVSGPGMAQGAGDGFYKGRTISLVSGFTPGGSYDFYSRLVGRHLGRHIAGNPTIVVQQMPGAGGLTAANYLYRIAQKDGTVIGVLSQTAAVDEALGAPGIQYKSAEFSWLGRVAPSIEVSVAWHTAKVRSIEDARSEQLLYGSSGPGSALDSYPRVLALASGLNIRIVSGYKGSTEALLAMEKGEVDASGTTWNTLKINRKAWLAEKRVNILVQYARARSPELPDVPAAVELGRTVEDRALLEFYMSGADVGRSIMTTPGGPPDRVRELRAAFDAAMRDPELKADIEKANAEFQPMAGVELQKLVEQTLAVKPELAVRIRAALQGGR